MNILFLDEKDWVKKVPYTIHYIAEGLKKLGNNVYVIDYDDKWTKQNSMDFISKRVEKAVSKIYKNTNVTVISPSFIKIKGLSRLSTLLSHSLEIKKVILKYDIDIIVIYAITNALEAIYYSKKYGIPLVFHSIDVLSPKVPYWFLKKPTELLEKILIRYSDTVFALTPTLASRAYKLDAHDVKVICNGVDINRINPNIDSTDLKKQLSINNEKVVLFVGTIEKITGVSEFLQIIPEILNEHDVKFLIVGGGIGFEDVKRVCSDLELEDDVILTGMQPMDRIPLYISLADICVSTFPPSKFSELNIPMKIFEYMAGGKPTISFDLPGTKSIIPEGQGVTYIKSFEEMGEKIKYLLSNEDIAKEIGNKGREFVVSNYSWDAISQQFNNALKMVINTTTNKVI